MMKLALALILAATPALADVRVIDGDTLQVDGVTWRLSGIDAPESGQVCADGWRAGLYATATLHWLVVPQPVTCRGTETDRFGRRIGICSGPDGVDLGRAMVEAGMAWAFVKYSGAYIRQESEARAARAGVHAHDCQAPWDWRAQRRQ